MPSLGMIQAHSVHGVERDLEGVIVALEGGHVAADLVVLLDDENLHSLQGQLSGAERPPPPAPMTTTS